MYSYLIIYGIFHVQTGFSRQILGAQATHMMGDNAATVFGCCASTIARRIIYFPPHLMACCCCFVS